jgi:hypothetical protein
MSHIKSELPPLQAEGIQQGCIGRRRLLRAGLAATPVVLAVSGRSAMAQTNGCVGLSLATWNSVCPNGAFIGSSHHTLTSSRLGLSPGYWKPNPNGQTFQRPYAWPIPPFIKIKTTDNQTYDWNSGNCWSYKKIASDAAGWATGEKYNAIFTQSSEQRSFSRILLDDNGSLEWHLCAAYLNAKAMPGVYVMTPAEVVFFAAHGYLVPGGNPLTTGQMKAFLSQTWA